MRVLVRYSAEDISFAQVTRLRTPINHAHNWLSASYNVPADFKDVAEGYERTKGIRMIGFRVEADPNINYTDFEYAL